MAAEYVIIDIETTGLNPNRDAIIEVAAVKLRHGLVVDELCSLIQPQRPVPAEITALTGIDDAMLAGCPTMEEFRFVLNAFLGQAVPVAHNAPFDSSFLSPYLESEADWLDTLALAQIAFPCQTSYALGNLAEDLQIPGEGAHRALADARMTAALFQKAEDALEALPPKTKASLYSLAEGEEDALCRYIAGRFAAYAEKPAAIFPAQSPPVYANAEERQVDDTYQLDHAAVAAYFAPGGAFEQRIAGFENRPQQLQMAAEVAAAFNDRAFLLAEAGTGTGKSLAYLLPAALFALESKQQVAVSTHTINLQEQLVQKDIPMLEQILARRIQAAVLKGRSNYLCLSLYHSHCRQRDARFLPFLMRLTVWLAQTVHGDGGELHLNNADKWRWQALCAAKENCLAPNCRFCSGHCFVQKSRAAAQNADLLILNHSLLLANASLEKAFLPPLPYLIVDEAHHLEKTAESQFTAALDFYEILALLGRLERKDRGKKSGLLHHIGQEALLLMDGPLSKQKYEERFEQVEIGIRETVRSADALFRQLQTGYLQRAARNGYMPATIRIDALLREEEIWYNIEELALPLSHSLKALGDALSRLWELLALAEEDGNGQKSESKDQLKGISLLLRMFSDTLTAILNSDVREYVVWLEFFAADKFPVLKMAPLEMGAAIQSALFLDKEAVVLTSATLTTGAADFRFFKRQVGLDMPDMAPREIVLPSPFFYEEQALFAICEDLPDLASASEIHCIEAISDALVELLRASRGRAVVLFTSHAQLKAVYKQIREPLAQSGVTVLAHGISGGPSHLLARLKKEKNCCILGANSFWEGIDVVGSALAMVVVVRLPFWPPNTPVMAARLQKMEQEGINGFQTYSLPQAIIRFKQGFGRLIRSAEDIGVFCVLDRRIFEKFYGRAFRQALPDMHLTQGSAREIGQEIREWLGEEE